MSTATVTRRATAASLVALVSLAAAACTSSGHKGVSTSAVTSSAAPTSTGSSSAAKATPTRPVAALHNPLTGIGPVPANPVIAVKIDDTAPGRPQVAIDKADVVYIEAVEGGLTRLAAVFATNMPSKVGYVRSTRPSDPDLLLQYGKITEAYSGGAHDSLPRVRRSGLTSWSNDAGAPYYFRSPHSGDHGYINLALDLSKVATRTKSPRAVSIGWTFSPSLAGLSVHPGTDVRTVVTGSNRGGTAVEFRYDGSLKKYVRYIGGVRQVAADGKPVTATNVIVQSCVVNSHPADTDVNGNPSQFTVTVGSGTGSVFRQGKRIYATWSRPHLHGGTTWRTAAGKVLPLDPGNTWVVLVHKGAAISG